LQVPTEGSGQTQEQVAGRVLFLQVGERAFKRQLYMSQIAQVRKSVFLRHLYTKMISLPRQARDKHRENSKKGHVSAGARAQD
jgi:hypothetical protein